MRDPGSGTTLMLAVMCNEKPFGPDSGNSPPKTKVCGPRASPVTATQ